MEHPSPDELEVSVFGPGFGECSCLHLGDGVWMVVDSCLDPATGRPWAIGYLDSLGVDIGNAVRVVVVTHFDDDHIRGITEVATRAASGDIVCSAAVARGAFVQFVMEQEAAAGGIGSGVDELRSLLRLAAARGGGIIWAKANLPLYPRPPGERAIVMALSPSENAAERSLEALALSAAGEDATPAVARRFRVPDGPNAASVATQVSSSSHEVLMGADLVNASNPETGWSAVLSYSKPPRPASLVKVPHHASDGAHSDDMWRDMLEDEVVSIVTPWARGGDFLPKQSDLDRLRKLCDRLYITAMPALRRAHKDADVERLIRRLHGGAITELVGAGWIRARRRAGEHAWRIEVFGDARQVD